MIRARPAVLAAAIAWALAPGDAEAEEVVVRTGEHGAFTRIVLGFSSRPDYALERVEGGYRVSVGREATYDLSEAWRRITRERVAAIAPGPGGALDIRLACECEATAFRAGAAMVVIDVAEAEPGAAPVARLPPVLPGLKPPDLALGLPLVTPPPAPEVEPEPDDPDLAAFGADLVAQMARGVEEGLLEPAAPLPEAGDAPRPVGGQIRIASPFGGPPVVSVDPDLARPVPGVCPSPEVLAMLPGGAEAQGGLEAVADARRALYGEFDRLDPGAARRLAGALLASGLGAEARGALRLAPMPDAERAALDMVAALMDGDRPWAGVGAVEAWAPCEPAATLWAVLALEGRPLPRAIDRGGVVGLVSTLPMDLRAHLAPRLAGAFLSDGDAATARLVRNAVTRAGGEPDRAMRLIELRLDLDAGIAEDAPQELAALAAGTDEVALEAATLLLQGVARPPPASALEDADLLVAERRGGPGGERLRALLAGALMDAARWDDGLALVADAPHDGAGTADLWELAARRLADEAADATFLRLAYAQGETIAEAPISPEAAAAIADRRRALGFGAPSPGEDGVAVPAAADWAAPEASEPPPPEPVPSQPVLPEPALPVAAPPGEAPDAAPDAPELTGPIALGQRSLEESRRRRAALAARLAEIGTVALDPPGEEEAGAVEPVAAAAEAGATGQASTLR